MDLSLEAIKPLLSGILLIATFCYGLMATLRRVPAIDAHPSFKAWLPLMPATVGTVLGVALPFLFPPTVTTTARGFIGALSGMFMGVIFATLRRQLRLYVAKVAGPHAKELLAPVDETGQTIPPGNDMVAPTKEELTEMRRKHEEAKKEAK